MRSPDDFIRTAEGFIGVVESPLGSNRTPVGVEYGWNGVAWCAELASVVCNRLGFPLHEAAVINIERKALAGWNGMGWTRTPTRASIGCLDFGGRGNWADMHAVIVSDVLNVTQFRTIEGNHHDRCERELRDMKYVRGFATLPFDGAAPTPQPTPTPTPAPIPTPIPPPVDDVGGRIRELQRLLGVGDDGIMGPLTQSAMGRLMIGWTGYVRPSDWPSLHGNEHRDLVAWVQRQCTRKSGITNRYPDDGILGPNTNDGIVNVLGQRDGICGPQGYTNACH